MTARLIEEYRSGFETPVIELRDFASSLWVV